MAARIFDITRCSLHDGSGIRTVIYLKGCSLQCQWCHNPEGISAQPEIFFRENRCIQCGRCVELCPGHHRVSENEVEVERYGHTFIREGCSLCMKCVEACPNEALVECGKYMTAEEVFKEIIKDRDFYEATGGGVTVSGGECLMYPDFLNELLRLCKNSGINTAVETAFNVSWDSIDAVRDIIDTFIIDIKHFDNEIHKQLTGCGNHLILANMERLSRLHLSILIRIPCIPDLNDDARNLIGTARIINTFGPGIRAVELLSYNHMGANKYITLGKHNIPPQKKPQEEREMELKRMVMKEYLRPEIKVL